MGKITRDISRCRISAGTAARGQRMAAAIGRTFFNVSASSLQQSQCVSYKPIAVGPQLRDVGSVEDFLLLGN
jgi:hypothetical protein